MLRKAAVTVTLTLSSRSAHITHRWPSVIRHFQIKIWNFLVTIIIFLRFLKSYSSLLHANFVIFQWLLFKYWVFRSVPFQCRNCHTIHLDQFYQKERNELSVHNKRIITVLMSFDCNMQMIILTSVLSRDKLNIRTFWCKKWSERGCEFVFVSGRFPILLRLL